MLINIFKFFFLFPLLVSVEIESQELKGHYVFFMPLSAKSSQITFMPVVEQLVSRGHEVTVVSPFASKNSKVPGLKEIPMEFDLENVMGNNSMSSFSEPKSSFSTIYQMTLNFWKTRDIIVRAALSQANIKEMFEKDSKKIDVVVSMPIMGNELAYFLAYKKNATFVLWSPQQSPMTFFDNAIGQPHNPALIGNVGTTFRHPMTFMQRLINSIVAFVSQFGREVFLVPTYESAIDEYFPENPRDSRPSLLELEKETALAFQFGHPLIMEGVRPMAPNYITIGMMNCRPSKKLPDDIQKFMDESGEDGVIFVSFGSVLKASTMSDEVRKILVDVFSRLKQRVLFKWESETLEGKTDNVMISKWLPQQDILAHPKLKLFVSHGGQSSCQESLCHKKPMVIIPVFGDQPGNGLEAELKGFGVSLPLPEITAEKLHSAINEILDNPKYSRRAYEHGTLLLDEINKPMDRAIWWLEYALRHPGMKHFRSTMHDLTWYQYFLIDVFGFILLVVGVIAAIVILTCKCFFSKCIKSKKTKTE